jgi:hypothetical protein
MINSELIVVREEELEFDQKGTHNLNIKTQFKAGRGGTNLYSQQSGGRDQEDSSLKSAQAKSA